MPCESQVRPTPQRNFVELKLCLTVFAACEHYPPVGKAERKMPVTIDGLKVSHLLRLFYPTRNRKTSALEKDYRSSGEGF